VILARTIGLVSGLGMLATAIIMLFAPGHWFFGFPGVSGTGPFNPHFVRDLGGAYFVTAVVLIDSAWSARSSRGALIAATAFLTVHALIHVADMAGMSSAQVLASLMRDFSPVYVPPLAGLWLMLIARRGRHPV
jgi:hypothetical protein